VSLTYLLPLRRSSVGDVSELASYLTHLADHVDVLVVDGSPPDVFRHHGAAWPAVTHVPVDPSRSGANGKVCGVLTGLALARHERVVIADDDVRYDLDGLRHVEHLLDRYALVRPQNYFHPMPWHAKWDTARTLLNRAFGRDYPGTLGVRRSVVLDAGGYDADTMFENLELMRTVEVAGGRCAAPLDLYVRRLPPETQHFWSQRLRQAFDDLGQPGRLALELALLPAAGLALWRRRVWLLVAAGAGVVGAAEIGRRRAGGARVFPADCRWWAPAWVTERALLVWSAVLLRLAVGGVPYRGRIMRKAANSTRTIRRRLAGNPWLC
jgi:hypothetical protein